MAAKAIPHAEWVAEGNRLFGANVDGWKFVCPACKHVATVADYKAAGAPESAVGFSCVGRWAGAKRDALGLNPNKGLPPAEGDGPCNYAGGGLFRLHPVRVEFEGHEQSVFAFASN